jgi:hypothetical protein
MISVRCMINFRSMQQIGLQLFADLGDEILGVHILVSRHTAIYSFITCWC